MRHSIKRTAAKLIATLSVAAVAIGGLAAPASAVDHEAGFIVSDVPASGTPHVLDGRVYSVVRVGGSIILGGTFTTARNNSSTTQIPRSRVLAFSESTGVISPSFNPGPNGTVNVVLPTGDGETVWVAGSFSSIGGVARSNIAKVRVSDGSVVQAFNAGTVSGQIKDIKLSNGRLWIAGAFTHVGGSAQKALATLDPTTGRITDYFRGVLDGVHNSGYTTVTKIDLTPQGDRLAAVGNFDTLDGVKNRQFMVLDTSGTTAAASTLRTKFYETACSRSFDSYMRDVDTSPDGSFFVVTTTGAYGGSQVACDTSARFDFAASGEDVRPSWITTTGGDTTYGVEVTDRVVYVGGHQRWQNNPFAGDRVGPGAVERFGVAALDTVNGLPYSWNPSRTRGVGLFDFLLTENGLWATSDTDRFGQGYHYRGRVAFLPNNGGWALPAMYGQHLPNDVYLGGLTGAATDSSVLYRVNAGGSDLEATSGIDWAGGMPYGSGSINSASADPIASVDSSVPAATPSEIFSTEAWGGSAAQPMRWSFPVPIGTEVSVRLYFANTYSGTSEPGQRVFNVDLDGQRVLSNYDIVAEVGHSRGVMKSFDVTSDGQVDIGFGHVTENPLVNGIEIVLKDATPGVSSKIGKRTFDGSIGGAVSGVPQGSVDWDAVRGAFMLNGEVYLAKSNGDFSKRSFNGVTWGVESAVNVQDELMVLSDWRNDISNMSGMFFDNGRIYFTRTGQNTLYYRYFNPESKIVGAYRYTASGNVAGLNFSTVRGMFQADDKLYWRTANGDLYSADWQQGFQSGYPVGGTASLVSGPSNGGATWDARVPFLFQDESGEGAPLPPVPPVAAFEAECTSLTCELDASASTAPGSTITSYAWSFSDGTSASGRNITKTFAASGSYTAELTVTTAKGGISATSQELTVERVNTAPVAAFDASCGVLSCDFDASASSDDDEVVSYEWDFGDDSVGTGVTVSHEYVAAGTYTVTLVVTDSDGLTDQVSHDVEVESGEEPGNEVPVAELDAVCEFLACEFDGSTSSDDDEIVSYEWDFGDGSVGTGVTTSHEYAAAGSYTVTLVVTDSEGLMGETSRVVAVEAAEEPGDPSSDVEFVDSAASSGNRTVHSVTVPSSVVAGDRLVLFASTNSNTTASVPAGWEQVETVQHNGATGWAWTKVAGAGDAGSSVAVTMGVLSKGNVTVAAYRSEAGTPEVAESVVRSVQGTTSVSTAEIEAASGDWVVNYWGLKSSSALTLSASGLVERQASDGTGAGAMYGWLGDSDGPISAGTKVTDATTSVSVNRALIFTLALR